MRDSDKFKLFTFCVVALVVGMVVYKMVSTSSRVTAIEVEHSRQVFWDSWDKEGTLHRIKYLESEVAHPSRHASGAEIAFDQKQLVKFLVYAGQRSWIKDNYVFSTYKRGPLVDAGIEWDGSEGKSKSCDMLIRQHRVFIGEWELFCPKPHEEPEESSPLAACNRWVQQCNELSEEE